MDSEIDRLLGALSEIELSYAVDKDVEVAAVRNIVERIEQGKLISEYSTEYYSKEYSAEIWGVILPEKREDLRKAARVVAAASNHVKIQIANYHVKIQIAKEKDVFNGDWMDSKRHGEGAMTYSNGNVYNGDWIDGKRHGKGVMIYSDGNVYNGVWINDKKNGKGVYTYSDGDMYDGDWINDKKHGKGVYTFCDGNVYNGDWINGKKHGEGVMTYANGNVYNGDWINDKMKGKGVYTFSDGNVYDGDPHVVSGARGIMRYRRIRTGEVAGQPQSSTTNPTNSQPVG
eukprot:gene4420-6249_t